MYYKSEIQFTEKRHLADLQEKPRRKSLHIHTMIAKQNQQKPEGKTGALLKSKKMERKYVIPIDKVIRQDYDYNM